MKPKLLNLSMLYVEDDERTRAVLSEVFKNTVKNLYVAKDGLEALKLFQEKHIQLIISDLKMPNMNGNELCSEVKKINPSVHFILLTAYNDNNLLIEAIDSGVDKFLQKPLGKKKLFLLLDEIYKKITN
ncbi:MAG: response regulator, partial [Sulfurimonas sp.]|nr:response regulator [Sulfurimonas sp.]